MYVHPWHSDPFSFSSVKNLSCSFLYSKSYLYCHVGPHDKLYFNHDHDFCFTWLIKCNPLRYLPAGYLSWKCFTFHFTFALSCFAKTPLQDFKLPVARGREFQFLNQSFYLEWKHFLHSVLHELPNLAVTRAFSALRKSADSLEIVQQTCILIEIFCPNECTTACLFSFIWPLHLLLQLHL